MGTAAAEPLTMGLAIPLSGIMGSGITASGITASGTAGSDNTGGPEQLADQECCSERQGTAHHHADGGACF